jgi:hypothetical protein
MSNTHVKYQSIYIAKIKSIESIVRVTIKNTCDEIYIIVADINIGKLRKIIKFNITLIFNTNINKYNFVVFLIFNIATFIDFHTAGKTF